MAETYELSIGNDVVKVPAWATEQTAKDMAKYSEGTAKAMSELLRQWDKGNRVATDNTKLFESIRQSTQNTVKKIDAGNQSNDKANKNMQLQLDKMGNNLQDFGKDLFKAFDNNSLSGMATAIAGVVGLAGPAGFAAGIIEGFSESMIALTNTGVGLGTSLQDLRMMAADAGMSLQSYAELVNGNGDMLRALGNTTTEGAMRFSTLSNEIRTAAREFNMFGLNNSEMNEILAEEINLRRIQGMEQSQIIASVSGAMNLLLKETTGLAAITGADRRELLRARQDALSDPILGLADMSEQARDNLATFSALLVERGGPMGQEIATTFINSLMTGINPRALSEQFNEMSQFSPAIAREFEKLLTFLTTSYDSTESIDFGAQLTSVLGQIDQNISQSDLDGLIRFASLGEQGAYESLQFISNIRGLNASLAENKVGMEESAQGLKDAAVIALPSAIEDLTNTIRAFTLDSILDTLSTMGVNVSEAGELLVNGINFLTDLFSEEGEFHDAMIIGLAGLFAAPAFVSAVGAAVGIGLASAIKTAAAGSALSTAASGLGTAAKGAGAAGLAKGIGTKAGAAGLGLSALFGMIDKDYQSAGYSGIDRAGLGIIEDVFNLGDGAFNILSQANRLWGGDGSNEVDISKRFRDWALSDSGQWALTFGRLGESNRTSDSTPDYYVPTKDNMSVRGVEWNSSTPGEMNIQNMDPSTAWRFRNSANPSNREQSARIEAEAAQFNNEIKQLMGKLHISFNEAVDELRRMRRVAEESN